MFCYLKRGIEISARILYECKVFDLFYLIVIIIYVSKIIGIVLTRIAKLRTLKVRNSEVRNSESEKIVENLEIEKL